MPTWMVDFRQIIYQSHGWHFLKHTWIHWEKKQIVWPPQIDHRLDTQKLVDKLHNWSASKSKWSFCCCYLYMKEDLWAVWSSTLWGNTCMIHRETFQDTVATAKKNPYSQLYFEQEENIDARVLMDWMDFSTPFWSNISLAPPVWWRLGWWKLMGSCVFFYHVFEKNTSCFKNPIFSNCQKLDEFSNLEPLFESQTS